MLPPALQSIKEAAPLWAIAQTMVVESTQREVTSLWYTTIVVISTTQHYKVGHNILVFIQTSACIKQRVNFQEIVQLKFVGAIYVEDVAP